MGRSLTYFIKPCGSVHCQVSHSEVELCINATEVCTVTKRDIASKNSHPSSLLAKRHSEQERRRMAVFAG